MAILGKNGKIQGAAGSMVFRGYRDKTVMQGKPRRGRKQTRASRASACEFGLISSSAKVLRDAFGPLFQNRNDGQMINRLIRICVLPEGISPSTETPQKPPRSHLITVKGGFLVACMRLIRGSIPCKSLSIL